ncbi:MAG: NADH-quinone oxidoreductase subunit NuoG [Pseudomonadales bacterium]
MPTIEVDGVSYEVREGSNLLQACLSHGLDLPYFCWHPSLGSVGACRQCAVVQYKDAEDTRGKLTMACMTPAADGARLSIRADDAVAFRASVIEWLMLNHPHDCPVCEEGGECHLQDMTVMTGHTFRRYRGLKRTFRNQYLGPFLNHEMNRCITCYRCVRFYRDYAGGRDLDAFGSRDRLYFGRAEAGVLQSEFAGNLVEVCPTGVFTDKPFSETYTRKWDLASAPSLCHGCSLGCNTLPGERYGSLKRVHNRYHGEVNGYFLCDRGRFGAAFVNAAARLRRPGARRDDGAFDELTADEAVARAAAALGRGRIAGIGSPRASMESNFALQRLVGAERFCAGFGDHEAELMGALLAALGGGARVPTLRDVESADAVLVLGEDVANSAPRLALALRQTVRNRSIGLAAEVSIPAWQDAGVRGHAGTRLSPMFQATLLPTRLDDVTAASLHDHPDELARAGFAIAHALDPKEPGPSDPDARITAFAEAAARMLAGADRPLVISGTGSGSAAVLAAAAAVARALSGHAGDVAFACVAPECNALGAALLGQARTVEAQLEAAARGEIDILLVMENDLTRRADADLLERALRQTTVIALDSLENATVERADLVLPAATFAESDGSWINNEGRAQRFYRVFQGAGAVAPSWTWLARIATAAEATATVGETCAQVAGFSHVDDVIAALVTERPDLAAVAEAGPGAGVRQRAGTRVPRQTHRASGRTAMVADRTMHEPRTPEDTEAPLSFSMEGYRPLEPGALLSYTWSPGWNSNQSIFKFQAEVGGALRGGPAGARIALTSAAPAQSAAATVPDAFTGASTGSATLVAVPLQDVFGSDELSALAPAIGERTDPAWAVLAPADAERLGIESGSGVRVRTRTRSASFVARVDPAMRAGAIGLVQGMTGALGPVPLGAVEAAADPEHGPPDNRLIARG